MIVAGLLVAGCGGDDSAATPDARAQDAVLEDAAAPCGSEWLVRNRVVDFDSLYNTPEPIAGATIELIGDPARTATTDTEGWFSLCVPAVMPVRMTLDAPGDYLDTELHYEAPFNEHPNAPGRSIRTITASRAASFYTQRGLTFDATAGHVLVMFALDNGSATLSASHDAVQSSWGSSWEAGDMGRFVLFPNVDVTEATAVVTESASIDQPGPGRTMHTVATVAGQLTFVAVLVLIGP